MTGLCARLVLVPAMGLIALGGSAVRADEIVLRGGGRVQGKIVADPQHKDRVHVWLLQGRKPLSFQSAQIVEVIPKPSSLDDYVDRRTKASATAEAQFELGTWCDQNKLTDLAKLHYETAIGLDKSFEPAHKKLGHVFHDGAWLTHDELSRTQGLFKHKGKWITAEEKSKVDAEAQTNATQGSWLRRIKMLRLALVNGPDDRRREAESQLMSIRDPDAITPLVKVFGGDEQRERRILLALVLSSIVGPDATTALARRVLAEPDSQVRSVTFDHLKQREDPNVAGHFVRALSSSDIKVINRAAWALGQLDAIESVPRLVPVLVTTESQIVIVGGDSSGPTLGGGMAPAMTLPTPLIPIAINKSGNVAFMTPPVVGNGVAAYGATAVPWYEMNAATANAAGFNIGNQINRAPEPKVATFTYQNTEVLAALQKLTGQDFGYDMDAWRRWMTTSFNPRPDPARRVPQPMVPERPKTSNRKK